MSDPRLAALQADLRCQRDQELLLDQCLTLDGLGAADRALARELAYGVVRHRRLYDWLASRFLRPGPQADELLCCLRLVCHQLFALDRIPPHAAVGSSVEALRQAGAPGLCGVANAVARRLAGLQRDERYGEGPLGRLPPQAWPEDMAVRHSLPDGLLAKLAPLFDQVSTRRPADLDRVPQLCTRDLPGRPPPRGRSILKREAPWTWWEDPIEALRGPVADGLCVVQDRAQGSLVEQAAVHGACRPGSLVLDLCAAPGGKTQALRDRGCQVIAADRSIFKAVGMAGVAPTLAQDGVQPAFAEKTFDLVVVDAPCSNSGVLARRPEARWRWSAQRLDTLVGLQRALLGAAGRLVAEGGALAYGTCSLCPAENQGVAHHLAGWRVLSEHLAWPDAWQGGGYAAILVRS